VKVFLLNSWNTEGGATRAAYRLMQGLRTIGVEVLTEDHRLAQGGATNRWRNALRRRVDALPLQFYRHRKRTVFSVNWFPYANAGHWTRDVDIVHLHWVGAGLLPIQALGRIRTPVLWTLHDMWAFTGGCHYDENCGRYTEQCGACPQLGGSAECDLSRAVWTRKRKHWSTIPLTIVSPSRWLANEAKRSSLFARARIEVIPYGLDLTLFKPIDKRRARKELGLPQDCRLVLFGAMSATSDPRKGFSVLVDALRKVAAEAKHSDIRLVVFGANRPESPPDLGLRTHYMGQVSDDVMLASMYAAADVMVVPSIQENLGNTIMEPLACGTPVVAFAIGGNPDMIDHKQNGYLATPFSADELANGISWVLADSARWHHLSEAARRKCELHFELKHAAERYRDLYEQLAVHDGK
jgi:glycosyltransferase involved in cell wall biosynthesis